MNLNGFSAHFLHELFQRLLLIRAFEQRAILERQKGLIPGFIHACIGQEATAVGACAALNRTDWIASTHRGHGHLLAKGGDPRLMMAELAGRADGYCAGRGGSLHITDFEVGSLGANGIVAGGLPIATGAALTFKLRRTDQVVVAFFGDGAAQQGAFHEALNLAGVWRLPIIFFCENNGYAQSNPLAQQTAIESLSDRAASYGFPGLTVDGNDVIAVYNAVSEAVVRARRGEGPALIEGLTYRWGGHYEGDPGVYRSAEEVAQWQANDPIQRFAHALMLNNLIDSEGIAEIEAEVALELDQAVHFAENSPFPDPVGVRLGLYTETHNGKVF
jgi:TPP-dependent pyruvate/acetoin dehydrogenase alpha subunit